MSYRPRGPPPYRYDGGPPFGGYPVPAGLFGPPGYVPISSLILLLDMTLSGLEVLDHLVCSVCDLPALKEVSLASECLTLIKPFLEI